MIDIMRLFLTFLLLMPLAHAASDAPDSSMNATPEFGAASDAYERNDYRLAIELLEGLVETRPECAECVHLLGRAYGRLAELSSWTSALSLVKKTRVALENAVALDPSNALAVEDLITFYRRAPGFLGGDEHKADELERHLDAIRADRTS